MNATGTPNQGPLCAIDFEFKHPAEPGMGIISVALHTVAAGTESFWLWRDPAGLELEGPTTPAFLTRVQELVEQGHTFVGYSIQQAEARCIAALGLDPNTLLWRDLMLEWRWLRNGDNRFSYGRIVKNDCAMSTVPPSVRVGKKASQEELDFAQRENEQYLADLQAETSEEMSLEQAGWSMLDCSFFFGVLDLGGYREAAATKARVRDGIIIQGPAEQIAANCTEILDYNAADVADLLALAEKMTEAMITVGQDYHCVAAGGSIDFLDYDSGAISRVQLRLGDWAARLAKYGQRGIPLHRGRLERLLQVVPQLTTEIRDQWVHDHPDTPLYRIGLPALMLATRSQPLKASPYIKATVTRDDALVEALIDFYCAQAQLATWPRTRTGKPDVSKKVISRFAAGENLIKQYERHQGNLSALRTYSPNAQGRVEALDFIGSDNRQRPDFGPYGTQTARNAARAKSFCFLGPHWMRILVDPEPGMAIVELDYGSQEVWIAAVLSGDQNMKNSYQSTDPYMHYAAMVGMYPTDLPIPTEDQRSEPWFAPFKKVRSIAKTLCLSMQYGAGARSVAAAVRDATKDSSITDEQGEEWVSDYNSTYSDYSYWVHQIRDTYQQGTGLALSGGWRMGRDNPSVISASNLPIQGTGSMILQEACRQLDDAGLTAIATLHDAITLYCPESEAEAVADHAKSLMIAAAEKILFQPGMKVGNPEIIKYGSLWLHSDRAKDGWAKLNVAFEGVF